MASLTFASIATPFGAQAFRRPAQNNRASRVVPRAHTHWRGSMDQAEDLDVLSVAEDLLLDSCSTKEGDAAMRCWSGYEEFSRMRREAEAACDVENPGSCRKLKTLEDIVRHCKVEDGLVFLARMNITAMQFQAHFTHMHEAFDATDTDGSGDITKDELHAMLNQLHTDISDEDVDEIFDLADADGNGVIDKHEFYEFLWQPVDYEPIKSAEDQPEHRSTDSFNDTLHWMGRKAMDADVNHEHGNFNNN